MYDSFLRGDVGDRGGREAVSRHQGSASEFLHRHDVDVAKAIEDGVPGIQSLATKLLDRIADHRALGLAFESLARNGGTSPGPDGLKYSDLAKQESWNLIRCLEKSIREGRYRTGDEHVRRIEKSSGTGYRSIALLNIADRVVQRASVLILQPIFDRLFEDRSFGFRPKRNRLHALAAATSISEKEHRGVWVTEDVADAFAHVNVPRLLQIVERFLPDKGLLDFLAIITRAKRLPGLRQGGSLSPLLLNLYLHHFLDRPWKKMYPDIPLIRYADDLLLLCRSPEEAIQARESLHRLLRPVGMPIKERETSAVRDLIAGAEAEWLGLTVRRVKEEMTFAISDRAWRKLEVHLRLAHTKPHSSVRVACMAPRWLTAVAPCYRSENRKDVLERVFSVAKKYAFEELPSRKELCGMWQRSYARWRKLLKRARKG